MTYKDCCDRLGQTYARPLADVGRLGWRLPIKPQAPDEETYAKGSETS